MSDSLFGWRSVLNLKGTSYKGCASLSNLDATQSWAGRYLAKSTKQNNFSVDMQLNSDHTATTTYVYDNGKSETREHGYWQQLNNNQVQVVMTHHQQQYLISERIFTRNNDKLTADKEKISGKLYTIAQGLTLYRSDARPETSVAVDTKIQVPSSNEFNHQVDQAVRSFFQQNRLPFDNSRYRWLTYDLNGDNAHELLVELNWCGSGGCTVLVFENSNNNWVFNSRITLVRTPIEVSVNKSMGWRHLIVNVSGGGAEPARHQLHYQGNQYPINPSTAPLAKDPDIDALLFSDVVSPYQKGIDLQ